MHSDKAKQAKKLKDLMQHMLAKKVEREEKKIDKAN